MNVPARGVAAAVAGGLVLSGLTFAVWPDSRSDERAADRPLPGEVRAGAPVGDDVVRHESVPTTYRIEYRVELWRGDTRTTSTEEVHVRRPFDGWRERRREGEAEQRTRTAFGRLAAGPVTAPVEVATAPGAPIGDLRIASVADEAIERGLIERREVRRVAGRPCQVYRFTAPPGAGPIAPLDDDPDEWADLCFDRAGLLLEELWVLGGRALERRLATTVEVDDEVDVEGGDERFAFAGELLDPRRGGGSLRRVDPASQPLGEFWIPTAPEGFTLEGRYAVVPPVDELAAERPNSRIGSVVDVFVAGPDFIAVDQGGTIDQRQALPSPGAGARTVDIAGLGRAELMLSLRANEVRVLLDRGRFVRVYGTVPLDELVAVAESLELSTLEQRGLVYVDEAP